MLQSQCYKYNQIMNLEDNKLMGINNVNKQDKAYTWFNIELVLCFNEMSLCAIVEGHR